MSRKLLLFAILNMLVILASLGVGLYSYATAGRYFARGVVYIAPRLNESHLHFSMMDIDLLDRAFPDYSFAAESRGSTVMASTFQQAITTVIYTDASYFSKHSMNFIEGTHWRDGFNQNVAVLNEALAWRLFGSIEYLAGIPVIINEIPYIVTGIVRQENANGYTAWMPREASANLPVTALYLRPPTPNPLAIYQARNMLTSNLRGRPSDYTVVDITRFVESILWRHRILLYIILVCAIFVHLRTVLRELANNRRGAGKIILLSSMLISVAVCVFILLGVNDILHWLPNLSNRDASIFESLSMIGVLPPDGYLPYGLLQISRLSRYTNYAFIAGLVGLVNLLFCLHGGRQYE